MAGTSPAGSYSETLSTGSGAMTPTTWFSQVDANWAALMRVGDAFAPRPLASPSMGVQIDAGFVQSVSPSGQQVITEVAIQGVGLLMAPGAPNGRIDLIYVDAITGIAGVTSGAPVTTPLVPDLPAGKVLLAMVTVSSDTTAIGNANISDRRASWGCLDPHLPWTIGRGTGDAIVVVYAPATPALIDGLLLSVQSPGANTTVNPTLNLDSLGLSTIVKMGRQQLVAGDIPGQYAELLLRYNMPWGCWELLNPVPQGITSLAAAAAAQNTANAAASVANAANAHAANAANAAASAISTASAANAATSAALAALASLSDQVSSLAGTVASLQSGSSNSGSNSSGGGGDGSTTGSSGDSGSGDSGDSGGSSSGDSGDSGGSSGDAGGSSGGDGGGDSEGGGSDGGGG